MTKANKLNNADMSTTIKGDAETAVGKFVMIASTNGGLSIDDAGSILYVTARVDGIISMRNSIVILHTLHVNCSHGLGISKTALCNIANCGKSIGNRSEPMGITNHLMMGTMPLSSTLNNTLYVMPNTLLDREALNRGVLISVGWIS